MKNYYIAQVQASPTPQPVAVDANIISLQAVASSSATMFLLLVSQYLWKTVFQPWGERQILRNSGTNTQDETISRELIQIIGTTNCDRALVVLFTNGEQTILGNPIRKCVPTQEETKRGITQVSNLLVSRSFTFGNLIMKALIDKPFQKRSSDEVSDVGTKGLYREIAADYIIEYLLREGDLPLGFISLHFREAFKDDYDHVTEKTLEHAADIIISNLLKRNNLWANFWSKK